MKKVLLLVGIGIVASMLLAACTALSEGGVIHSQGTGFEFLVPGDIQAPAQANQEPEVNKRLQEAEAQPSRKDETTVETQGKAQVLQNTYGYSCTPGH